MAHHMLLRDNRRYYPVDHRPRKRQRRGSQADTRSAQDAFTHNTHTLFFRLPRELRDQVYEFVWNAEDDFLFRYRGIAVLAKRPHVDIWLCSRTYGLPSWLLASQAILHEGMQTLHRTSEFLGVNDLRLECEMDGAPLRRPLSNNPLLFNYQIRRVGFHHDRQEARICGPYRNLSAALYWTPTREQELFVSQLRRIGAKNLHFHMEFSHTTELGVYNRSTAKQHPRLKQFDVLPEMCKQVDIDMGMYLIDAFAVTLSEEMLEETRNVVRQASGKMIAGKMSMTVTQWRRMSI